MPDPIINADGKSEEEKAELALVEAKKIAAAGAKPDDQHIPKSRFDTINLRLKDAVTALEEVAESLAQDVPEQFQSIIPDLEPGAKIKWIRACQKSGIFDQPVVKDGLDTQRSAGKAPQADYDKMHPDDILKAGYSTTK